MKTNKELVIPKFACSVCGEIYDFEDTAMTCATQLMEPLSPVGLVFRYYDTNHSSRVVAIVNSSRNGHKVVNRYFYLAGSPIPDARKWEITCLTEEFWKVVAYLAGVKILPIILRSKGVDTMETEIVSLEGLFQ